MIPEIAADPNTVHFTELAECGHWLPEEQPEEFVAALGAFLASVASTPTHTPVSSN